MLTCMAQGPSPLFPILINRVIFTFSNSEEFTIHGYLMNGRVTVYHYRTVLLMMENLWYLFSGTSAEYALINMLSETIFHFLHNLSICCT